MTYSIEKIAEKLGVHPSVIENYEEEWQAFGDEAEFFDESFFEYLSRTFAEYAFLQTAFQPGATASQCLEAYDEAYTAVEDIIGND